MSTVYSTLVSEITAAWARSDTTLIPTWLNRAQRIAVGRHNFAFMRTSLSATVTSGTQTYALPSDFKDDVLFYLQTSTVFQELPIKGTLEMLRLFSPTDDGSPEYVTLETGSGFFKVWPIPDATYTIVRDYWAWPADLSSSNPSNWISLNFPQLLVHGALAQGFLSIGAAEDAAPHQALFEQHYQFMRLADIGRQLGSTFTLEPRFDAHSPAMTARSRAGWSF